MEQSCASFSLSSEALHRWLMYECHHKTRDGEGTRVRCLFCGMRESFTSCLTHETIVQSIHELCALLSSSRLFASFTCALPPVTEHSSTSAAIQRWSSLLSLATSCPSLCDLSVHCAACCISHSINEFQCVTYDTRVKRIPIRYDSPLHWLMTGEGRQKNNNTI